MGKYSAHIDAENFYFVIEDRDGNVIAIKPMPSTSSPNPGKDKLMEYKHNRMAWQGICDLIEAANKE